MFISRSLLWWNFRAAWLVTLPAMLIAAGYVLFAPEPLKVAVAFPIWFILLHTVIFTLVTGRFNTQASAFLYTRGFSRNCLWMHRALNQILSVAAVWLAAGLVVWSGLRSAFQDHMLRSAYYPLFRSDDALVPLAWLGMHLVLISVLQYAPIRRAQPTFDRDAGFTIAIFFCILALFTIDSASRWVGVVVAISIVVGVVSLIYGSWRLHQRIEIYP
jgi:hypothetical protein